ncbi:MAG: hypothetical protein COT73_02660 [Bdellovibrio sp. CG10_big_fil_rev_8_21_14_0_10_47_8]|nr:MAG: hypothetical protein COT73_02660 [Bdellovibrio sp. CG10_big_fil_rev_8_21_14_0_10_47_8]
MNRTVFLKKDLVEKFGDQVTVSQVFSGIENDFRSIDEVVCQFKLNNMALDEGGEMRLSKSLVTEIETLEVLSQKPSQILSEIVINWMTKIPMMIEQTDNLSSNIRFQGIEGHLKTLVTLIDDCQLLIDSILSIDSAFQQVPFVQSQDWKKGQSQMADGVGEALDAFQKKDFTRLADVLEYDLGHFLQSWFEILSRLQASLKDS